MIRHAAAHWAFRGVTCAFLPLLLSACAEQHPSRDPLTRPIPRTEVHHAPEPLVTPVPDEATLRSHVRLAVRRLGTIEYDGQVLPLVSPDGDHVASSIGAAPSWPALLGEPDAAPPAGARIVIYDVPVADAPSAQRPSVSRAHELPHAALMLGRSTDDRGFLVESPRPDGSRWIGFADWETGVLDWLIRDEHINAHAVLAPNSALACTRRKDANSPAELVYFNGRHGHGPMSDAHELTWRPPTRTTEVIAPAFGADGTLYAFVLHHEDTPEADRGVELLSFTLNESGLAIESRLHLSTPANPRLWIHQALAPLNGWQRASDDFRSNAGATDPAPAQRSALTFFHPDRRNIVTLVTGPSPTGEPEPNPSSGAALALIDWADESVAWAPAAGPGEAPAAAFLATPDGLVYQVDPSLTQTTPSQAVARALATPGIPRATRKSGHFLLLSPASGDGLRALDLFEFRIQGQAADEEKAPSGTP